MMHSGPIYSDSQIVCKFCSSIINSNNHGLNFLFGTIIGQTRVARLYLVQLDD
jgi:nucleoside permease NupC